MNTDYITKKAGKSSETLAGANLDQVERFGVRDKLIK